MTLPFRQRSYSTSTVRGSFVAYTFPTDYSYCYGRPRGGVGTVSVSPTYTVATGLDIAVMLGRRFQGHAELQRAAIGMTR